MRGAVVVAAAAVRAAAAAAARYCCAPARCCCAVQVVEISLNCNGLNDIVELFCIPYRKLLEWMPLMVMTIIDIALQC